MMKAKAWRHLVPCTHTHVWRNTHVHMCRRVRRRERGEEEEDVGGVSAGEALSEERNANPGAREV